MGGSDGIGGEITTTPGGGLNDDSNHSNSNTRRKSLPADFHTLETTESQHFRYRIQLIETGLKTSDNN